VPLLLDPEDTFVVVHCYPTGHVYPWLLHWLLTNGAAWDRLRFSNIRGIPIAYNQGVKMALESGMSTLLFADHDVIPVGASPSHPATNKFLEPTEHDIVCCPCRLDIPGAWADPDTFHCGMWRTTREALLKVSAPWFLKEHTPDGTALSKCECAYFAAKAREVGLTIARKGWADHRSRGAPET